SQPGITFNPDDEEYLVVWSCFPPPNDYSICGQRISSEGALLDNPTTPENESDPTIPFMISSQSADQREPAVAYNTKTKEYLVVWNDTRNTAVPNRGNDIYGQRVDRDGALLGTGPDVNFPISTATGPQFRPDVAFAGRAGQESYLVVWNDERVDTEQGIHGQRVGLNGALLDNPGTPLPEIDPDINFVIMREGVRDNQDPRVAYNEDLDEYLVVWNRERLGGSYHEVSGQRVDYDGDLLDNPHTPEDESTLNTAFAIAGVHSRKLYPDVTYHSGSRQYLVVWADYRYIYTSGADIYGARVSATGALASQGDFVIGQTIDEEQYGALAADPANNQYFVVWQGGMNIHGQRVWWPGLLIRQNFVISTAPVSQEFPAVAFNNRDNAYLAIWYDERDPAHPAIYGQRYDAEGISQGHNFIVTQGYVEPGTPALAYNSLDNFYVALWESTYGIRMVEVSAHGVTQMPFNVVDGAHPALAYNATRNDFLAVYEVGSDLYGSHIAKQPTGYWHIGNSFPICTDTGEQTFPDVVYNPDDDEFLVVWEDTRDGYKDIYGRRVGPAENPLGTAFAINNAFDDQEAPAVTYNPEAGEYFVAWSHNNLLSDADADIIGQRVAGTGTLVGAPIEISTSAGDDQQIYPTVAYVEDLNRYRVIWQDNRDDAAHGAGWDLRGQWVSAGGAVLGLFDDPLSRMPGWQQYPALAAADFAQALVVWQDGRNGVDTDVYGRLGAIDTTAPRARFTVEPSIGEAGATFAFNAFPSRDDTTPRGALLVRWDLNSDGVWDPDDSLSFEKYITRTVMLPGTYTVTLEVWDLGWLTDTVSHQIEVLPAAQTVAAAPPTTTLTVSPVMATAGTVFALDGAASTGSGQLQARWDWENDGLFDTAFNTVLTATHVYTTAGDVTVRLEVQDGTGLTRSATQNLVIRPAAISDLEVLPGEVRVAPNAVVHFKTKAKDAYENVMYHANVVWSLAHAQAGALSATGVFTAGIETGAYPNAVRATANTISDAADVIIAWPNHVYLPILMKLAP
ncbi:MAG: hypothetical protein JXB35_16240, partial [Anaerolineae bacterium]|nr:hypothetical protein [Anaerolineae bacterium]